MEARRGREARGLLSCRESDLWVMCAFRSLHAHETELRSVQQLLSFSRNIS